MSKIIQKWLNGQQNYTVGVAIYKAIGTDKLLKQLFDQPPTDYSKKRLQEELKRLNQAPAAVVATIAAPRASTAQEWQEMPSSDDEPVLRSLQEQWKPIYSQMNYLRHQLDQFKGNDPVMIEQRKPLVFQILDLEQQCLRIWSRRDHFIQNKRLPEDVVKSKFKPVPTDPVKLAQYIENLARNIRRNKSDMEKHPDQPQYAQRSADYSEQYFKVTGKHYKEES
jgi:hypothetical protein